jgi:hypothetical protein
VNRYLTPAISFENASAAREIGLENIIRHVEEYHHQQILEHSITQREILSKNANPTEYLCLVEPFLSEELVSSQNFVEIRNLAEYFTGGVTSFFGFETSLTKSENQSDFLFAVSSKRGEREALVNLMKNHDFLTLFGKNPAWQHVIKFSSAWINPDSMLYEKVLGIWFEFDAKDLVTDSPVPNIFIHPVPIQPSLTNGCADYQWLLHTALPLLKGECLPKTTEQKISDSIEKLPGEATLFQVGIMLARSNSLVRLVIKRIQPDQILPYLTSIGWSDDTNGLSSLIRELKKYVTRMVLHISVGEDIDTKIGLECSFAPDLYHQEHRWLDFFTYLKKKELCLPEKKTAVFRFPGIDQEDMTEDFNFQSYMTAAKIPDNHFSSALVRYISHVKISYEPHYPLDVKVYSGVRLFGSK